MPQKPLIIVMYANGKKKMQCRSCGKKWISRKRYPNYCPKCAMVILWHSPQD